VHIDVEHSMALPHWPVALHVWMPPPGSPESDASGPDASEATPLSSVAEHCVAPGAQTPVQAPDTQA